MNIEIANYIKYLQKCLKRLTIQGNKIKNRLKPNGMSLFYFFIMNKKESIYCIKSFGVFLLQRSVNKNKEGSFSCYVDKY